MTKKISIAAGMCVLLISSLVLTLLLSSAFGDRAGAVGTKVVVLKDGRTFTGTVTEDKNHVKVKTKFGVLTFPRDQVQSVTAQITPMDEYLTRRSKVDSGKPEACYKLAEWGWENHPDHPALLRQAIKDLDRAIALRKDYPHAMLLKRQIRAKLKILDAEEKTAAGSGASRVRPSRTKVLDEYLLSDQDVFWVRLMELRKDDNRVGVRFVNNAQNRFIEAMEGSGLPGWESLRAKKKFRSQPRFMQVREMLREMPNNTDLLQDIHITTDPKFFIGFRKTAWPKVLQYCAATQCHGGPKVNGGLKFLVYPGNTNKKVDYTNFIILVGSSSQGRPLIDRDNATDSLLLQYGLTAKVAKFKHPKINSQAIRRAFSSINDPTYKATLKWIKSLKGPVPPDYHLGYVPPFGMKLNTSGRPGMPVVPKDKNATDTPPSEPLE